MSISLLPRIIRNTLLLCVLTCTVTLSAHAIPLFATSVVSYDQGTTPAINFSSGLPFNNASAALGEPSKITGTDPFVGIVSTFNPPYLDTEIVSIGEGGHLTLKLPNFITVGAGKELGVFTNTGMADDNYPNGQVGNPAFAFGIDQAIVEVSRDGQTFVSLGLTTFDHPTQPYINAGPFDTAAPDSPIVSDFGKPNPLNTIDDYNGMNYAQLLTALDGSAGGTWIDLDSTGLSEVGYVRFSVLDDFDSDSELNFELDAVALNSSLIGNPTPEPSSAVALLLLSAVCFKRRKV